MMSKNSLEVWGENLALELGAELYAPSTPLHVQCFTLASSRPYNPTITKICTSNGGGGGEGRGASTQESLKSSMKGKSCVYKNGQR